MPTKLIYDGNILKQARIAQNKSIGDILRESLAHELSALNAYKNLLNIVGNDSVMLEEYAREMIYQEELHLGEVDKMLRKPGDLSKFHA
ncbi:hypothetical protein MCEHALHM7_00575 [Methylophilaceae bacterium]